MDLRTAISSRRPDGDEARDGELEDIIGVIQCELTSLCYEREESGRRVPTPYSSLAAQYTDHGRDVLTL